MLQKAAGCPLDKDRPAYTEYAGAPLRTSPGVVVGALCVIDTKPRDFSEADRLRLQATADELMKDIERRTMVVAEDARAHAPASSGGA